jgi:hypothetical protein
LWLISLPLFSNIQKDLYPKRDSSSSRGTWENGDIQIISSSRTSSEVDDVLPIKISRGAVSPAWFLEPFFDSPAVVQIEFEEPLRMGALSSSSNSFKTLESVAFVGVERRPWP